MTPHVRRLLVLLGAVAVLLALSPATARAATHTVPAWIPDDCSANVQTQLNSFIAGVPDGSTIQFPAGRCYAQNDRIVVRDKRDLVIDLNGSTFRNSAANDGTLIRPNWMLLRDRNTRIQNGTIVGNFNLTGARSQARVNDATVNGVGNQFNPGVGVWGGDTVSVTDLKISKVFGDGVLTGLGYYIDGSATDPLNTPTNVRIERVEVTTTARHCISPSQGNGVWLEDSVLKDCWYGGLDAELDDPNRDVLKNVHLLRNTFDGFFMFGIALPVAGNSNTTDIEIRGNRFLTPPDNQCNQTILVGAYPTNPNTFSRVTVDNNDIVTHGLAVSFDHVVGGSLQHNKITQTDINCSYPNPTPITRVTNSSSVTVADNGPTAAGTGGSPPPAPPPPTPPPSGCSAPSSVTGTRVNTGDPTYNKADLTWTHADAADSYKVYLRWHDSGNPYSAYTSSTTRSATLFSLLASKSYDVQVTAICGAAESPRSPTLVLPTSGTATSGTTSTNPSPPPAPTDGCAAPTNLVATPLSNGKVKLDWAYAGTAAPTAFHAWIKWSNTANPWYEYATFAGSDRTGSLFSLIVGKPYDVSMTATCGSTTSPRSASIVVVPS